MGGTILCKTVVKENELRVTLNANIKAVLGMISGSITYFKIKAGKIARGHDFTLMKEQSILDIRIIHFSRGTSKYGITYQLVVCMLVVLIC